MRILVAGTGSLAVPLLATVLRSRHEVVAVLQDGRRMRRGLRSWVALKDVLLGPDTVRRFARRHGIPVIWIDRMDETELAAIADRAPDLLLVYGFGIILKPPLLAIPTIGCVNVHPSLLPRHRGPNPFAAVIQHEEAETGVSFHIMVERIDSGDLLHQARIALKPTDTTTIVRRAAARIAAEHVLDVLDRIEQKGLVGIPQDVSRATYDRRPTAADLTIRWDRPASEIDALVRAWSHSRGARFRYRGRIVYITAGLHEGTPVDERPGTVLQTHPWVRVATGRGAFTITRAHSHSPIPWRWPAPWLGPVRGEILQ